MKIPLILFFFASLSVGAATRTVTSPNDDNGIGTLRATIAASASGDTIIFDPVVTGTITLTNGQLTVTTNLTISGPGAAVLSISGHTNSRVFNVTGGTVNISGLTISDGSTDGNGGGIFNSAALNVSSCILSNNSAFGPGGAIWNSGNLTASHCMFLSNSVLIGAGGGLFNFHNGTANVSDSAFFGNVANTNSPGGGGLFVFGNLTLTNCTISGNFADQGAGINCSAGAMKMSGCTVCSNVCNSGINGAGGGLYLSGTLEIQNSIIAGNSSSGFGPDVFMASSGLTSDGFNLIGATNDSRGWATNDLTGSTNLPLDPMLGPLQNNGGLTWTHALKPGSPAVDAGNSFGLAHDQRGRSRPVNLPNFTDAPGGDGSDIGAFEVNPPVLKITPFSNYVLLSWPTSSDPGYGLQSSGSLSPPVWEASPGNPSVVGDQYVAVDTIVNQPLNQKFYRLKQ